jgi:phage gp36-like protein
MSYATQSDMEKRFSIDEMLQLTDKENTGVFNNDVFAQAQLDGDAEIDAYLRPLYQLPLDTIPPNLVRLACDVYRFYLYGSLVPEFVEKRYDQAVSTLKLIMSGKMDLNPDHNQDPAPEPLIHISKGQPSVFTHDRLRNF